MLFKDRLEVWNPGRLPKGMTVEKLNGEHASLPVNPLLANPVYLAGYIEQVGTGTNDVIDRCVELGLRKPEFRQDEDFTAVLWRKEVSGPVQSEPESLPDGKEPARSWQGVGKELGVDFNILKDIADFCVEAHSLSEIAEHLGLSDRYKMKKKYIDPLLGKCFDMTIPNSPNNPGQKYYLTELGKALLNNK